jgi:hypothetical protein
MNICLNVHGYDIRLLESPDLTPSHFLSSWVWIKSDVHKRKVDTPDELLSDAAGCIKQRADQLRRTTRDLRTPVAKCSGVGGGTLGHLLRTVTGM